MRVSHSTWQTIENIQTMYKSFWETLSPCRKTRPWRTSVCFGWHWEYGSLVSKIEPTEPKWAEWIFSRGQSPLFVTCSVSCPTWRVWHVTHYLFSDAQCRRAVFQPILYSLHTPQLWHHDLFGLSPWSICWNCTLVNHENALFLQ